ncbi:MAG: glycosyltransferase [Candidatus Sericytochromatia bacterium]|nr:glycosyltransferase [Candidatus Sericytochromatia bacterium]
MAVKPKRDLKKLLKIAEKRTIPKLNSDQKFSLCMIVKNESKNIARCLESVEGVVDEIIVVDTGSTDDTVEIAKKYGAKVFFYEWSNDFAVARNEAIKNATGDWILILDADEELSPESREIIRAFLVKMDGDATYQIRIKNMNTYGNVMYQNYMTRMFKNTNTTMFVGRIHETLISRSQAINISGEDVFIIHHGYKDHEKSAEKITTRNIPLLEEILKKDDINNSYKSFVNFYIGASQLEIGNLEDSLKSLRLAIDQSKEVGNANLNFIAFSYIRLMSIYISLKKLEELEDIVKEAEKECPRLLSHYEFWYYKASIGLMKGDNVDALKNLKKCVDSYNDKSNYDFNDLSNDAIYYFALLSICNTYMRMSDKENTLKWLDRLRKEVIGNFDYPSYKQSIYTLYAQLGEIETAIGIAEDLIDLIDNEAKNNLFTDLTNMYMLNNQFAKAVNLQAKFHDPEKVKESWYIVAANLEDGKLFPTAEEVYSEIIKVLPDESRAYVGRSVARLVQNKANDAINDLVLAKSNAKDQEQKQTVGKLYIKIGRLVEARQCFEDILIDSPENYQANLYIASIDQSEGKISDAQSVLERLIDLFPNNIDAYIQLGNILLSNKNADKSIEVFEKAKNIQPDNAYLLYALALAHLEKNNKEDALSYLEKAIKIEPDNEGLLNLYDVICKNSIE